jgi:hypothetical protein
VKASDAAVFAFVMSLSCGCAEGYGATDIGLIDNAALAPTAGMMGDAPLGGSAAAMSTGGTGGVAVPPGEPCTQTDVKPCPCEGTDVPGQRICRYDMASPTDGFFAECGGCPPPTPPEPDPATLCGDGMQNGAETGIDCGGPDCMACPPPPGGAGGTAGSGGTGGAGGASGTSGEGGSAGEEEPDPEEPVEDCEGVPEGTECDRDCILPSNTARCNSRGDCSCLG